MESVEPVVHRGGCHCRKVRYEVAAPADIQVLDCNCSICTKSGYLHLIVTADRFQLLSGADELSGYRFDTGEALHLFCRHCGIKSYYIPRSHPDGFSVNARCLDEGTVHSMTVTPFNGKHWELGMAELLE